MLILVPDLAVTVYLGWTDSSFLVVGSYRKKRVPDVECISRTSLRNVKEYRVSLLLFSCVVIVVMVSSY